MKEVSELHKEWMEKPGFRQLYEEMRPEFELASAIIAARKRAGLTQAELAERMGTKQSFVARLESGTANPSQETLKRVAKSTNSRLSFSFVPA